MLLSKTLVSTCKLAENPGNKPLSMKLYDSHIPRSAHKKLSDANKFAMFIEHDSTDILTIHDSGAIHAR